MLVFVSAENIFKILDKENEKISATVIPETIAAAEYAGELFAVLFRRKTVSKILNTCSSIWINENCGIFSIAVKYPPNADDIETNGRLNERIFKGIDVLLFPIHDIDI